MADASKNVNIKINTTADTAGAEKAAKSLQSIGTTTNVASSEVTKGSRNMAFALGNVGNQMQDIAVQAQSGTSAITILAQQGPQLLSGFGPQGAIAGAVVALGGLILSTMIKSTEEAKKAAEDAWMAADEFATKTAEAYKKAGGQDAEAFLNKSLQIAEMTRQGADAEIDLANQQRERIKSQASLISSQEALAISAVKYLAATGQITDAEKQISEIQKTSREAQKSNAIADIEAGTAAAQIRYKTAQTLYEDAKTAKARIEEEINTLQQQQQTVNRQANISRTTDAGMVSAGVKKAGYQSTKTSQFESQLAKLEGAIAALQSQSNKAPDQIQKALQNVYSSAESFDLAQKGAAAQIQELETKFNVTESTQALNQGLTQLSEGVKTLQGDVAKLEPINTQQKEAKAILEGTLSDGQVTAGEMLKNASALQLFQSTIKTGQEGQLTVIQEMQKVTNALIASNNSLVAEATRQAGIIKSLPAVSR